MRFIATQSLVWLILFVSVSANRVTFYHPAKPLTCDREKQFSVLIKDEYKGTSTRLLVVKGERTIVPIYLLAPDSRNVLAGSFSDHSSFSNGPGHSATFAKITDLAQADRGDTLIVADHSNFCLRAVNRNNNVVRTLLGNCNGSLDTNHLPKAQQWKNSFTETEHGYLNTLPGNPTSVAFDERKKVLYVVMHDKNTIIAKLDWPIRSTREPELLKVTLGRKYQSSLLLGGDLLLSSYHFISKLDLDLKSRQAERQLTVVAGSELGGFDGNFNYSRFNKPQRMHKLADDISMVIDQNGVRVIDFFEKKVSTPWTECNMCQCLEDMTMIGSQLYITAKGNRCDLRKSCIYAIRVEYTKPDLKANTGSGTEEDTPEWVLAVSISLSLLVLLLFVAVIVVLLMKKKKRFYNGHIADIQALATIRPSNTLSEDVSTLIREHSLPKDSVDLMERVGTGEMEADLLHLLETYSLPIKSITIFEKLGTGHFGNIHKGLYKTPSSEEMIAVKLLRTHNPSIEETEAFLREALIMSQFTHPNVMDMLGLCCYTGEPVMIAMPYMAKGDLLNLCKETLPKFNDNDLLDFSHQIAEGMNYLATEKFVHRDLAARNCLVDAFFRVKIADFGLSRDIYGDNYYVDLQARRKALPWKWMAVECLRDGKFSSKTDVWAYGVLMWELFTCGGSPYPAIADANTLQEMLVKGYRLPKPTGCPEEIHEIMKLCWKEPEQRPTFKDLAKFTSEHLNAQWGNYAYATDTIGKTDEERVDRNRMASVKPEPAYCDTQVSRLVPADSADNDTYLNFSIAYNSQESNA